ncbi:MAG: hypothetical protein DRJ62_02250 [Thermoprotei archaeon]|nr:MAG: hypothetical protein DRJ62_02250 [Thermoprotei archaeon]
MVAKLLPSNLLRVKRRGFKVLPRFAELNYENEYAASLLIDTYQEHVGKTIGELEDAIDDVEDELEDLGYHPKFVRGLIELLDRLIEAQKPETKVPPDLARRTVFAVSSQMGFATTPEVKVKVFEEAAKRLNVSVHDLIKAFEASYEDSEIIISFNAPTPVDLLRQYNLSLTQTLTFKAMSMDLVANMTGGEAKSILRTVKMLGLMYMAEKSDGVLRLHIDGPASLLVSTRRYGTRMARLIPLVLRLRSWRIRAEVLYMKRRFLMELDERFSKLMPSKPPIEETFDSMVEEDFMLRFQALGLGWRIVREPEPLMARGSIFIPDFALYKGDVKVYLEIVGFWTPEYIERKMQKLLQVKEPMIIAVNKHMACSKESLERLRGAVVVFDGKLRASDLVPVLRRLEPVRVEAKQPTTPSSPERLVETPLVEVSLDEVSSYLSSIGEEPLEKVLSELRARGVSNEQEAYRLIRSHGLMVLWRGLDPSKAVVKRVKP